MGREGVTDNGHGGCSWGDKNEPIIPFFKKINVFNVSVFSVSDNENYAIVNIHIGLKSELFFSFSCCLWVRG